MSKKFEYKTMVSNDARLYMAKTDADENFKLHRWDGPAIIPLKKSSPMEKSWYLWGMKYTKDEFEEELRNRNGVPFHKTEAGKQAEQRS